MKFWKIGCLIISLLLIFGGWLGHSYFGFQKELNSKISAKEWNVAENILDEWEKTSGYWFLKNISCVRQGLSFQRGWLLAQRGDYEKAVKEFRSSSLYNAATLSLAEYLMDKGRESLERLADDYIKVLGDSPNDFQAKVNLEIVRILQKQAKEKMAPSGQSQDEPKGIKNFKLDKDEYGSHIPGDQKQGY